LASIRQSLINAKKTIMLEKIEYVEHTCPNGDELVVVNAANDKRYQTTKCAAC
jgi:hypothetical protein